MNHFFKHRALAVSSIALLCILLLISPGNGQLNIFVLSLPFILLFIVLYNLGKLVLAKVRWPASVKTQKIVSAAIAATAVVAIMLQSLGQLTIRDFLLLSSLAVLFVWYLGHNAD